MLENSKFLVLILFLFNNDLEEIFSHFFLLKLLFF